MRSLNQIHDHKWNYGTRIAAFWARTRKMSNGCIEWLGHRHNGYGRLRFHYKIVCAHRIAWADVNGPIPAGLFVCHKCDNRLCVNPEHLFLGTHQDNMADMVAKRRQAVYQHPDSYKNIVSRRKIKPYMARKIRKLRASGVLYRELAVMFGVSPRIIWKVLTCDSYLEGKCSKKR